MRTPVVAEHDDGGVRHLVGAAIPGQAPVLPRELQLRRAAPPRRRMAVELRYSALGLRLGQCLNGYNLNPKPQTW